MSILGNGAPQKRQRRALGRTFAAHSLQIPAAKNVPPEQKNGPLSEPADPQVKG